MSLKEQAMYDSVHFPFTIIKYGDKKDEEERKKEERKAKEREKKEKD